MGLQATAGQHLTQAHGRKATLPEDLIISGLSVGGATTCTNPLGKGPSAPRSVLAAL
jgi:hypothetical protein